MNYQVFFIQYQSQPSYLSLPIHYIQNYSFPESPHSNLLQFFCQPVTFSSEQFEKQEIEESGPKISHTRKKNQSSCSNRSKEKAIVRSQVRKDQQLKQNIKSCKIKPKSICSPVKQEIKFQSISKNLSFSNRIQDQKIKKQNQMSVKNEILCPVSIKQVQRKIGEHHQNIGNSVNFNSQENCQKKQKIKINYNKNSESNIINQIFSFLSSNLKSQHILEKCFGGDEKKIKCFYQILNSLKKRKKKNVNRSYLLKICTMKDNNIGYKMLVRSRGKTNVLSIQQFQKIMSILIVYYLKNEHEISLLTSKKINKLTMLEHLKKTRQIKEFYIRSLNQQNQVIQGSESHDKLNELKLQQQNRTEKIGESEY